MPSASLTKTPFMKKIMLSFSLLLLVHLFAAAQCDKAVNWKASKVELMDENGNVLDALSATIVITVSPEKLVLDIPGQPNDRIEGRVDSTTCEWKKAYTNGKSVLKSKIAKPTGETASAVLTIEGMDGKFSGSLEITDEGKIIRYRIQIDDYEEVG